jgi:hypothetical protein
MSGCAARIPYFTVASNSADRLMRLRAGSTANEPDVAIRQITLGGPCGADSTRLNVQRGSASVDGSRARGLGAGCSAGRSACPWSRRSPRCIELKTSEPSDHFTSTSVGSGLAAGRRGPQTRYFGSQPYRRLSGDCLRVLTSLLRVKPGLPQWSRPNIVQTFVVGKTNPRGRRCNENKPQKNPFEWNRTVGSRTENC